jgi:integrase
VRQSKGGKSRVVPICDELADELLTEEARIGTHAVVGQADGRPLAHNSIGHIFERWLTGRGIRITPHQLRRTFATELYRRGEDLFTIQRLLGHSDPKTTLRYIGASSEKEHEAVAKLVFRT